MWEEEPAAERKCNWARLEKVVMSLTASKMARIYRDRKASMISSGLGLRTQYFKGKTRPFLVERFALKYDK